MSWQAVKAVANGPRSIKGSDLNVLFVLAEWADEHGVVVPRDGGRVRVKDIEDQARCVRKTVQSALRRLEAEGYLTVEQGGGAGVESAYQVNIQALEQARADECNGKNGANITPFNRKNSVNVTPYPMKKGGVVTPFPTKNGAIVTPNSEKNSVGITPYRGGIKEPNLETIEEIHDSNQNAPVENVENDGTGQRYSPYIAAIVTDYSAELGDQGHTVSNVSQALKLYQRANLDEAAFANLLHRTRKQVRTYQGKQGMGTINNKMAYFFQVLRNELGAASARGTPLQGDALT